MLCRKYSCSDWSKVGAWRDLLKKRVSFASEEHKFAVLQHYWRKSHTYAETWGWYAKRLRYEGVPRQGCPIPEEAWPEGYLWATWVEYNEATCCGFELVWME